MFKSLVLFFVIVILLSCASQNSSKLLIGKVTGNISVKEYGSSNQVATPGLKTLVEIEPGIMTGVEGIPNAKIEGTGLFNHLDVQIKEVGGDIVIERDLTGNIGVDISDLFVKDQILRKEYSK